MRIAVLLLVALTTTLTLSAPVGTYLAVNTFKNNTNAVVSVDSDGDLTYVSGDGNSVMQKAAFSTFPSAAAIGKTGTYYCGGMISNGAATAGAIFSFAKNGAQSLATTPTPFPVLSIAEDVNAGKLFTYLYDLNGEQVTLVSWTLPLTSTSIPTKIAALPAGWLGISTGGSYDPSTGVYYVYLIGQTAQAGTILGVSVMDGSIVSNTTQLNTATVVTAISVDTPVKGTRYIALTQDPNDPKGLYFLSTIDVSTGITTKLGTFTFLDQNWTPMSVSVCSVSRRWIATFQGSSGDASLIVADLDSGKPVKSHEPWPQGDNVNDLIFSPD